MVGYMMFQLLLGFASTFIGRVIFRFSAKLTIAAGALLMGIGFVLLSLTQTLWQFYLFYAIVGVGSAAAGGVPTSMIVSDWFEKRRGFAIGILGTGIGVGGFVMPILLGTYVMPNFGWRMGYIVSGIISAGILIPFSLWLIKPKPADTGLLPDQRETIGDNRNQASNVSQSSLKLSIVLKTKAFWLLVIAFTVFGIANSQTFQNAVPHLQDVGFSAVFAASTLGIVGIGSAIGKFGFGWLCDFIPSKYILVIGSALQTGATLILMTISSNSPEFLLWLFAFIFGLGVGSWFPAVSLITSDTFGLTAFGDVFGIYYMLFMISSAIGPWLGGYVFDTTRSYSIAFLLCLVFYAIAIPCMILMRRPKLKKQ
jgi:MFS family permease